MEWAASESGSQLRWLTSNGMDWRTRKQLTILFVVFLFIFSALTGIYFAYIKTPATCTDDKKNQGEAEADCGGPCAPCAFKYQKEIEVFFARFVPVRANTYDIVAEVQNPNSHLAANPLSYRMRLFDDQGVEIGRRENITFVYPNDRIYIIEPNFVSERRVARAEVEIAERETRWEYLEELRPELTLGNKVYIPNAEGAGARVTAELVNKSLFGFQRVEIRAALLDGEGNIIGVAKTIAELVHPNESRQIELIWPQAPEGLVATIDLEARANALTTTNILLR